MKSPGVPFPPEGWVRLLAYGMVAKDGKSCSPQAEISRVPYLNTRGDDITSKTSRMLADIDYICQENARRRPFGAQTLVSPEECDPRCLVYAGDFRLWQSKLWYFGTQFCFSEAWFPPEIQFPHKIVSSVIDRISPSPKKGCSAPSPIPLVK